LEERVAFCKHIRRAYFFPHILPASGFISLLIGLRVQTKVDLRDFVHMGVVMRFLVVSTLFFLVFDLTFNQPQRTANFKYKQHIFGNGHSN